MKICNLDTYRKKIRRNTLSVFDEISCYLNEIENNPWNCYG